MATVAPDLLWECIKTTSCYMKKTHNKIFSTDGNSLTNTHSLQMCGVVHAQPVGLTIHDKRPNTLMMTVKQQHKRAHAKPKHLYRKYNISKGSKGLAKIESILQSYRPSLLEAARKKHGFFSKMKRVPSSEK